MVGLDSIRKTREEGSWVVREQPIREKIVAKIRSEEKDLTQRALRSEHRGRREKRFLTARTPIGMTSVGYRGGA